MGRRHDRWEALCHRCGLCCYEREALSGGGVRIDLTKPCPYLDSRTQECTVYETRFRATAYCGKVTLFHALLGRRMPLTCGYVQRHRGQAS